MNHNFDSVLTELWMDANMTIADISAKLGMTRAAVLRHRERLKLPEKPRKPRQQYDAALLFRLWHDESVTPYEIAESIGCSAGHLWKVAKRYGLAARKQQPQRNYHDESCDPTPEEIEQRKAEIRAKNNAAMLLVESQQDECRQTVCYKWDNDHFSAANF